MTTVNKNNVKLWIDALRSGNYEQGQMVLSGDNQYCCLGVACEVFNKHNPDQLRIEVKNKDNVFTKSLASTVKCYNDRYQTLPETVIGWLGLHSSNPDVSIRLPKDETQDEDITIVSLAELNDDYGLSFSQIADIIEQYFINNAGPITLPQSESENDE